MKEQRANEHILLSNYDEINQKIEAIFLLHCKKDKELLMPKFYDASYFNESAKVLFVGMNPAGTEKDFPLRLNNQSYRNEQIQIEKKYILGDGDSGIGRYPYYQMFENYFQKNWNAIDLFVYRGTNQKELEGKLGKEDNLEFFEEQYKLFLSMVTILNPQIMVVANATASHWLKKKWYKKEESGVENRKGCWHIPKELVEIGVPDIPVLFTSMLSGQRALDVHSRDMLIWHIERIINLN